MKKLKKYDADISHGWSDVPTLVVAEDGECYMVKDIDPILPRWVSIEHRIPDVYERYAVIDNGMLSACWGGNGNFDSGTVSHWLDKMPPKPETDL